MTSRGDARGVFFNLKKHTMAKLKFNPTKLIPENPKHDQRRHNNNVIRDLQSGYGYRAEFGRANMMIDCPFCGTALRVYVWSLAGGGKRCECGALLSAGMAFVDEKLFDEFIKNADNGKK